MAKSTWKNPAPALWASKTREKRDGDSPPKRKRTAVGPPRPRAEPVKVLGTAECDTATEKAIHVKWGMRKALAMWIPLSAVSSDSEVWEAGQSGRLVVYRWWARLRGI